MYHKWLGVRITDGGNAKTKGWETGLPGTMVSLNLPMCRRHG